MKLVSIVIPSYNHDKYIKQAVESALRQTYRNIELIVVDDGSSDKSIEYLRSIHDPRYQLIEQENMGADAAINKGLSTATGDYLTILNSDDIFHLDRVQVLLDVMEKDKSDLLATWIEVINHNGKILGIKKGWQNMLPWDISFEKRSFISTNDFKLNLIATNFVSTTSNMMFRRKVFERIGGMRKLKFAHDWDFLLRVASEFSCSLVQKPLLMYRVHKKNTISCDRRWMLFEICWVLAANMPRFEGVLLYNSNDVDYRIDFVDKIWNSINLQGNDKLLWMIQQFINSAKKLNNEKSPEELLLYNTALRDSFLKYVKV